MIHIDKAIARMRQKNWDKIYIAIDLHGTIIKPTYSEDNVFEYYSGAKECLKMLSDRKDVCIILWTSTHSFFIDNALERFMQDGIQFDYVNENPEVENTILQDFSSKFHFDILLDDKAGFDPLTDWEKLHFNIWQTL